MQASGGHATRHQRLAHGLGAIPRQRQVGVVVADGIGVAFKRQRDAGVRLRVARDLVQHRPAFLAQAGAAEVEIQAVQLDAALGVQRLRQPAGTRTVVEGARRTEFRVPGMAVVGRDHQLDQARLDRLDAHRLVGLVAGQGERGGTGHRRRVVADPDFDVLGGNAGVVGLVGEEIVEDQVGYPAALAEVEQQPVRKGRIGRRTPHQRPDDGVLGLQVGARRRQVGRFPAGTVFGTEGDDAGAVVGKEQVGGFRPGRVGGDAMQGQRGEGREQDGPGAGGEATAHGRAPAANSRSASAGLKPATQRARASASGPPSGGPYQPTVSRRTAPRSAAGASSAGSIW